MTSDRPSPIAEEAESLSSSSATAEDKRRRKDGEEVDGMTNRHGLEAAEDQPANPFDDSSASSSSSSAPPSVLSEPRPGTRGTQHSSTSWPNAINNGGNQPENDAVRRTESEKLARDERTAADASGNGNKNGSEEGKEEPAAAAAAAGPTGSLDWRERVRHFTWTWFTMTMATGGVANVLYTVPFRFHGLYAIGCIFFILNIVLFLFNVFMISLRFYIYPSTFTASFKHPTESLFIPASIISFGTILINISQYGVGPYTGEWLDTTMTILYWIYCGLAIVFSCGIYLIMWSTQTFTISQMTPVWIFPAYPLLIVGPHAGQLATKITNPTRALDIILGGYILQGIGFLVSLMIYSAFLYRLMTQKLPQESLRPGMFISVGPSGFTISGLMTMGRAFPTVVPTTFMGAPGALAGEVTRILANWAGLWLWGLAFWFFFVSVGAHASCATRGRMDFAMTWYSFIFPNTALTTATFAVGHALGARAIQLVGCVLAAGLVALWAVVFALMCRAVACRQVLWPQKQEDREEGGWKEDEAELRRRQRELAFRLRRWPPPPPTAGPASVYARRPPPWDVESQPATTATTATATTGTSAVTGPLDRPSSAVAWWSRRRRWSRSGMRPAGAAAAASAAAAAAQRDVYRVATC